MNGDYQRGITFPLAKSQFVNTFDSYVSLTNTSGDLTARDGDFASPASTWGFDQQE